MKMGKEDTDMSKRTPHLRRPTVLWLCYGLFSVLCHLTGILLFTLWMRHTEALLPLHRVLLWVEHSLMSLVIVGAGGILVELTAQGK